MKGQGNVPDPVPTLAERLLLAQMQPPPTSPQELRKWAIEQAIKAGYCTGEEVRAAEQIIHFVNRK